MSHLEELLSLLFYEKSMLKVSNLTSWMAPAEPDMPNNWIAFLLCVLAFTFEFTTNAVVSCISSAVFGSETEERLHEIFSG